MLKKILLIIISILVILVTLVIGWDIYVEEEAAYEGMEVLMPIFCKREVITLQAGGFFDYEKLEKVYLSKLQARIILKKIENNANWQKGEIDERTEERLKFYTREDIYNQIPYVENKYWIFTNRSNGAEDKHSIEEVINTLYYSTSFGLYDVDNNILYYYEYAR